MKDTNLKNHFDTLAIHLDEKEANHAVTPPIYMTSTFEFDNVDDLDAVLNLEREGNFYTRGTNPTIRLFEKQLAKLEGGVDAVAFSSGMGAVSSVLISLLSAGDEIIAHRNVYGCTYVFTNNILSKFGVKTHFVDLTNAEEVKKYVNPKTRLVFLETPTNPSLEIIDIQAIANAIKGNNIKLVVDNTFASPYFQSPFSLGADIVLHSATKYISGHCDVIAGVVIANDQEYLNELKYTYMTKLGSTMSPFNAWLLLKGMKTLGMRMRQHEQNATKIVEFLSNHPKIEKIMYPGVPSHPNHEIAKKQMSGFGGVLSFEVKGDKHTAYNIAKTVKFIKFAPSLGGAETLLALPGKMTHRDLPEEEYAKFGFSDKTIRLSIGLEDYRDIINDLKQAIENSL